MLADTADLIINLTLKDQATGQLKKTETGLSGLQKAALGVATLGFGAMTKGALQAEEAQGKFMAATGKSREEAKNFVTQMDGLAGSAGAVGLSFEEIAETGTMVEQQFGTTGEETRNLTDDILKFAKVTGSDASDMAGQLEDTLSSMGLEAGDAAGFMDTLVASSQKYGTDIGPELLGTLQDLGPQMTALGLSTDETVGFMNAMEKAGVPAKNAVKDLTAVVKEFPDGLTMDSVVKQLGAIEDPAKRAQRAVELLGAKAGPQMAAIIKPGMVSLADFGVSADEAAGSLDQAADDMLTTSDRIKGGLEKLGAGFREVGQMFGPFITGFATIAPAMTAAMSKVWSAVGSDQAIEFAGRAAGTKFGAAFQVAAILAIPAAMYAIGQESFKALSNFFNSDGSASVNDAGEAFNNVLARNAPGQYKQAGAAIGTDIVHHVEDHIINTPLTPIGEALGDGMVLAFQTASNKPEVFQQVGHTLVENTSKGVVASQNEFAEDARETVRFANQAMMREAENANKVGDALADGLLEGIPDIRDAWKQFLQETKNALDPMTQITWLEGRLAGDKLADALASKNPLTRRRAEIMRDDMMAQLDDLKTLMGIEGTKGSNSLANNLNSGPVVAAAQAIMRRLENIFNKTFTVGVGIKSGTGKGKKAAGEHVGGGGLAHGGPAAANSIHEVNELGAPEMLTAGGRNYLLMGRHGGNVTPFMPGGGVSRGGAPMTLNVNLFLNSYQVTRAQEHFRRTQGGQFQ